MLATASTKPKAPKPAPDYMKHYKSFLKTFKGKALIGCGDEIMPTFKHMKVVMTFADNSLSYNEHFKTIDDDTTSMDTKDICEMDAEPAFASFYHKLNTATKAFKETKAQYDEHVDYLKLYTEKKSPTKAENKEAKLRRDDVATSLRAFKKAAYAMALARRNFVKLHDNFAAMQQGEVISPDSSEVAKPVETPSKASAKKKRQIADDKPAPAAPEPLVSPLSARKKSKTVTILEEVAADTCVDNITSGECVVIGFAADRDCKKAGLYPTSGMHISRAYVSIDKSEVSIGQLVGYDKSSAIIDAVVGNPANMERHRGSVFQITNFQPPKPTDQIYNNAVGGSGQSRAGSKVTMVLKDDSNTKVPTINVTWNHIAPSKHTKDRFNLNIIGTAKPFALPLSGKEPGVRFADNAEYGTSLATKRENLCLPGAFWQVTNKDIAADNTLDRMAETPDIKVSFMGYSDSYAKALVDKFKAPSALTRSFMAIDCRKDGDKILVSHESALVGIGRKAEPRVLNAIFENAYKTDMATIFEPVCIDDMKTTRVMDFGVFVPSTTLSKVCGGCHQPFETPCKTESCANTNKTHTSQDFLMGDLMCTNFTPLFDGAYVGMPISMAKQYLTDSMLAAIKSNEDNDHVLIRLNENYKYALKGVFFLTGHSIDSFMRHTMT